MRRIELQHNAIRAVATGPLAPLFAPEGEVYGLVMGRPDSWLVLGFLGVLVVVPVLCAALAVVKGSRVALVAARPAGATGLRGRVLMMLGHDLENDSEPLTDRVRCLRHDGRSIEAALLVCTETGMTQAEAQRFVSALH
jgi:hypothetical protein